MRSYSTSCWTPRLLAFWSLSLAVLADSWSILPSARFVQHGNTARQPLKTRRGMSTAEVVEEASGSLSKSSGSVVLADDASFVKPERDRREYRAIQLANGLQVLLVSDQMRSGVGTEAASVHVQAGHFDDTIPGLAHFHEHMLFLGTSKYPKEDEYEGYLSQFGGYGNAYTDMEDTNYFFSVTTEAEEDGTTTEALEGALDRFAQFFIAPTFDRSAVDRELKAIDSEYRNSKTSDAWRNFQLLKASCDQRHPFSNFGCGNYETLSSLGLDRLLEELENFWKTYYQTYNLRLAVVGHGSLDNLQQSVETTFGQLPASTGEPRRIRSRPNQFFEREGAVYGVDAFAKDQVGLVRKVIPVTEMRTVKIYFSAPPLDDPKIRSSKAYRALSHILGHESPGSLHALLNELGYLSALTSGVGVDTSDFSLFTLTLALTPKGMQAIDEVLDLAFQWISLLRENKELLPNYHEELRRISEMNFRFRENGDPTDFCSTASELLFDETPLERLLWAPSDCSEYDTEVGEAFLDRLRPENCLITILNSDLDENDGEWETEKWYGAKYRTEAITEEQNEEWKRPTTDKRLWLPDLNRYIPTDFSLRCDDSPNAGPPPTEDEITVPPNLLIERPNLRMWHKMDRYWRVPKTHIKVALLSSKSYQTPRTMTLTRIFQRVLNDDLNSFVYDASLAGLGYRVSCTPYGYRFSLRGYSEKLPFLLDTLTTRILSLIDEMKTNDPALLAMFERAREGLLRETKNYRLDPPHEVANYNSRLFMEENVWYLDNYINEMEGEDSKRYPLTMLECAQVAEECFTGRVKCEALCMGNIDEAGAREVTAVLDRHFLDRASTLSEVETPRFRSLKLPTREEAVKIFGPDVADRRIPLVYQDIALSDSEENSAVEVILQAGCEFDLGYEGVATLDLITHMAYNSAYNQLRTKEQLGYLVSAFARKTAGSTWGMSVIVQSSVALPDVLEQRCEAWLELFRQEIEDMSSDDIAQEASAVVAQLLETETKLSQEVSRSFGEILNTEGLSDRMRQPAFDRLDRLARELTVAEDDEEIAEGYQTADELKAKVLAFFDRYFAVSSTERRAMAAWVYSAKSKDEYESNVGRPGVLSSYSDMRHYKQFLSSWPNVPYWRVESDKAQSAL